MPSHTPLRLKARRIKDRTISKSATKIAKAKITNKITSDKRSAVITSKALLLGATGVFFYLCAGAVTMIAPTVLSGLILYGGFMTLGAYLLLASHSFA